MKRATLPKVTAGRALAARSSRAALLGRAGIAFTLDRSMCLVARCVSSGTVWPPSSQPLPALTRRATAKACLRHPAAATATAWSRASGILACGILALAAAGLFPLRSFAAGAASTGLQQSFFGDSVKATVAIPSTSIPRFGFVPIRFAVDNSQPRELRWRAEFRLQSFTQSSAVTESHAVLSTPASRNGERWVFVPVSDPGLIRAGGMYYGYGYSGLNITVNGPAIAETSLNFSPHGGGPPQHQMVPWAVSASLEGLARSRISLLQAPAPAPGPAVPRPRRGRSMPAPGPGGMRPLVSGTLNVTAFDPGQSLGDWRAWSPFARVILRADEFETMPPANRAALRSWVALGGSLYFSPAQSGSERRERVGAGEIVTLAQPIGADEKDDSAQLFSSGGVLETTAAVPATGDLAMQKTGLSEKISPAKKAGDWLVYFFIGFAVLIAPINLFAIAPARRRHWLFFTVPAISLLAAGILFTAIWLQDGVGGEGARRALVVLLPGENQAAVFQEQVSRTGLLLGGSFPLADDTICASVPAEDINVQPGRAFAYHRADGIATGDWFRARAVQAQHLRRLTPTRARVERVGQGSDGAPIVQSSIGATLREFFYVDRTGATWTAEQVAPGARVTLARVTDETALKRRLSAFAEVGSGSFKDLVGRSTTPLLDRFVALASDSDLAPIPTFAAINWKNSAVMVVGAIESTTRSAP